MSSILSSLQNYSINIYSLNNVSDMRKIYFKKIIEYLHKTNVSDNLVDSGPIVVPEAMINYNPE